MNLKSLFNLIPPRPPRHTAADRRALRRQAVSRVATGNVLLQSGRYATKDDIAARRKKVLSSSRK